MKRKIITLALVVTMALSFAACGDSNTQSGGSAESSAPAEQVEQKSDEPVIEEQDGIRKETYYTNKELNLSGETGPIKYTVSGVQVSNVSTTEESVASLLGIEVDQKAGLVVVNFDVENTSTDTISWYPDQATITTNTQEQADANMFLNDGDVGGDYIGNVKKSGQVMFILPNSDAKDLTQVSIHVDGPYDANFNTVGDAATIDIPVNQ